MPFALAATTHFFAKTIDGGLQRVVVKDAKNVEQIRLIRAHLRDLQARFQRGDFSGPSRIHGPNMPGIETLKSANPGAIVFVYRDVDGGAEIAYHTTDATLIAALHTWLDAQLSDHRPDAIEGHEHGQSQSAMH